MQVNKLNSFLITTIIISVLVTCPLWGQPKRDFTKYDLLTLAHPAVMVNGLPGWDADKKLYRLPLKMEGNIRDKLWNLGTQPSGGRVRFHSTTTVLGIVAHGNGPATPHHMTSIMKNGIDVYVNDQYAGSAWPDKTGKVTRLIYLHPDEPENDITIYLPLYGTIEIDSIFVDKGAEISAPTDLKDKPPIIYYGSSITQGGCASNPGASYQAFIGRENHIDFINLGFSGNGIGDIEIAQFISELDASMIVLDHWANPKLDVYKKTMAPFVEAIRSTHKETPILLISPFFSTHDDSIHAGKREFAMEFVESARAAGDKNIYFFDGTNMFSKEHAYGAVDGEHLNSLGFWFCAQGLAPEIDRILAIKPE